MINRTRRVPLLLILPIFVAGIAATQVKVAHASATVQSTTDQQSAEITSHDVSTTFKVNVKLVLVRVVVRDSLGHIIDNLHKEDFQVFDKGKPQVISQFEVEQPGMQVAKEQKSAAELSSESTAASQKPPSVPERYIAYVFDDEHLKFGNLATVREAAKRHFESLLPTDRAAVFTTSGKTMLDFTYDRSQLNDALSHIAPPAETASCPDISYYMADLIVNKNDQEALQVATQDYLSCTPSNSAEITARQAQDPLLVAVKLAPRLVPSVAMRELGKGDMASHLSLDTLKDVIKRVSLLPGQRSVVLVSPGFLIPRMQYEFGDIVDRAIHSQVMINVIDARGLYALIPGGDASKRVGIIDPDPKQSTLIDPAVLRSQYQMQSALEETNVLSSFADETGGAFVHNNNDFDDAFRRVAGTPEYSYLLGFSPENLKSDDSFHPLKVVLKNQEKVTIQARRGYFAPRKVTDPEEEAKQEILDALFSREEIHELPVELHTQFFKASNSDAKVTVLAHVDVQRLHFRKADGRNDNVLTCDSALFDQNGSYRQGVQKVVSLHLKDETLEHKLPSGITLKTSFDVKPGSYLVRLVVRDAEGQLMFAETGAVEIP